MSQSRPCSIFDQMQEHSLLEECNNSTGLNLDNLAEVAKFLSSDDPEDIKKSSEIISKIVKEQSGNEKLVQEMEKVSKILTSDDPEDIKICSEIISKKIENTQGIIKEGSSSE